MEIIYTSCISSVIPCLASLSLCCQLRKHLILLWGALIVLNLSETANQTFYVPPAQSADNHISQLEDLSLHFEY